MNRHYPLLLVPFLLLFATPAAASESKVESEPFGIVQLRVETGNRQLIRFNKTTGESWVNWTTNRPAWTKIDETGPVTAGSYEVYAAQGINKDEVWAVRFDRKSGKTWNYGQKGWEEFSEPK